jgi:hypothetical protein
MRNSIAGETGCDGSARCHRLGSNSPEFTDQVHSQSLAATARHLTSATTQRDKGKHAKQSHNGQDFDKTESTLTLAHR